MGNQMLQLTLNNMVITGFINHMPGNLMASVNEKWTKYFSNQIKP
jgi:hypothetical protein